MEIKGIRETQLYLVEEVQKVYRDQGVSIHDKHIELIVRQMTRRIGVQEPGDTDFLPGERVDAKVFRDTNRRMVEDGQAPGRGPARADGHHQGVAGHRVVAVGGVVPGDHPGAHRGRHRRPRRQPDRPQGEHHHRQADPGRHGHDALPRVRRRGARLPADGVLLDADEEQDLAEWLAGRTDLVHSVSDGELVGVPTTAPAAAEGGEVIDLPRGDESVG